jgi:Na+-driven multidrug efflux pump
MLRSVFTFLGRVVICYLVVFFGTLLIWQLFGVTDREGGKGMALAFVIAPVLALLAALLWQPVASLFRRPPASGTGDRGTGNGG